MARGGLTPPGFYGDGKKFGSPEGFKALKLQQWRTEEKIMARGVGGRGGYSHMNPSREEGKKEPKGGLGVTIRVRGLIKKIRKKFILIWAFKGPVTLP